MTKPDDFMNSMRHLYNENKSPVVTGGAGERESAGSELKSRKCWVGMLHPDVVAKVRATRRRLLENGEGRHAVRKIVHRLVVLHWRAVERNIMLNDAAHRLIGCNEQFRDVLTVAAYLAAGPSHKLAVLWTTAKALYREAQEEVKALEEYHGGLPPDHRAAMPRPSWAGRSRDAI